MHNHTRIALSVEELEKRELLNATPALQIGDVTEFRYEDSDGDIVLIRIEGSAGQVWLNENTTDGIGNEDGELEDGEELGQIIISDAAADFRLMFVHDDSKQVGNGRILLGNIEALDQVIEQIFTENGSKTESEFVLTSFTGTCFSEGGGLFVDSILGRADGAGILLKRLSAGTSLSIDRDLLGDIYIDGNLAGDIRVGNLWQGNLTVGGDFAATGQIIATHDINGAVTITRSTAGTVDAGGWAGARWLLIGHVLATAQLEADEGFSNLHAVRNFFGSAEVGTRLILKVEGSIGAGAKLTAPRMGIQVGESFFGQIAGQEYVYLRTADSIGASARISAVGYIGLVTGRQIIPGARIRARQVNTYYVPEMNSTGTAIGRAPFVITQPGYYRFTNHLVYSSATGAAIEVRARDVTIDLQGYALIGTAGSGTGAYGILARDQTNVVIRNGTIRGFQFGIRIDGLNQGAIVRDIRAIENWYFGIWVESSSAVVRNNWVLDTGGSTFSPAFTIPIGIRVKGASAQIYANVVSRMLRISPYTHELVGLHVDAAPNSRVVNNIFANHRFHEDSWGMWVNFGDWFGRGGTNALVQQNLFIRLDIAVTFVPPAHVSRGNNNIMLEVANPEGNTLTNLGEWIQTG